VTNAAPDPIPAAPPDGAGGTVDSLFGVAYEELKWAARHRLRRHRAPETISTTVLVHEAYVRLADSERAAFRDRPHFLAVASRAMRFVLIDHARRRDAEKRGAGGERISIDEVEIACGEGAPDLLALHDALEELTAWNPRLGQLVEYRFFGGLTYEEIASITGLSVPTLKRDWIRARTWLFEVMQREAPPPRGPAAGGEEGA
jgi:RNA polymerase sigma factor (TIGR02999 family)